MNKREMQAKIDELTKRNDAVLAILVQAIDGPRLPNVRDRLIADAIALMGGRLGDYNRGGVVNRATIVYT